MNPFAEHMFVLFAILALGHWLGQIRICGISLGTAGVLFAALIFGHFGLKVPKEVMDLGLLLFVYSVGLQSGPHFFRSFRKSGIQFTSIATVTVVAGAAVTVALAMALHLPFDLACGLYTGAMTCTPALAAAMDAIPNSGADISVAYGVAYPYSMIGMVVLMQFLPKLLGKTVKREEETWFLEQESDMPKLLIKQFMVSNPNCAGLALREISKKKISHAVISRVRRGETVMPATPDVVLAQGDTVMAVGSGEELDKLKLLLGEETNVKMDMNTEIVAVDVEVTESALAGKKLGDLRAWEHHGVVITRIRRQGMELTATGPVRVEIGDILHAVGDRAAVDQFTKLVDADHRTVNETNMFSFLLGLLLGTALGLVPFRLPNGMTLKLGLAGGAFIVSILLGHFGRVGNYRLYVPQAAKNFTRELGLMLFLAGAGTSAGAKFVELIRTQGWTLLFTGAAVTTSAVAAGVIWMHLRYKMNALAIMGSISACMTNPPALGAASAQTRSDLPTISYASVYPVALIFKIILAQLLVQVFRLVS